VSTVWGWGLLRSENADAVNYYNEIDSNAAARLRSLISAGLIPPGHVDQRSIADVQPADLAGFTQCHFFAGIGGWPEALRLAGVSPDMPLWTGSCPCQPFSSAGQRKGTADERHLWPVFRDLIAQCSPPIVFGEQVASADGRNWLASVRSEMEALGYAVGAADLCAAGVGAPHIRQRLYFVGMADAYRKQWNWLGDIRPGGGDESTDGRDARGMGNADSIGARGDGESVSRKVIGEDGKYLPEHADAPSNDGNTDEVHSFWRDADWLWCRDGKWRPVEPGTFPLANGVSGRVALLRGYGNAIVPQVAAAFIRAALTT
jgi:DNA (cytosine-5)-methyltransferase 1